MEVAVVEGFDAEGVASEEGGAFLLVPDAKGEHAAEASDHGGALGGVKVEEDLGIGVSAEIQTLGFALGAEFAEVVDFAIEADDVAFVVADHGLVASGREVKDRQACVGESSAGCRMGPKAEIIRSAVEEGRLHGLQGR